MANSSIIPDHPGPKMINYGQYGAFTDGNLAKYTLYSLSLRKRAIVSDFGVGSNHVKTVPPIPPPPGTNPGNAGSLNRVDTIPTDNTNNTTTNNVA
ncbi:hypothetical protein Tco_1016772 [Tanacetum coccineum]|uniref:Uncharacterized protein n=1 Tax=Tanacetum coccineum TaxID=301880 RepID=A0ABQ5FRK2_9ASTR